MRHFPLFSCQSGIALLEFAFVFPLLLVLLVGTVDVTRFILINQKLDKLANTMADFATQGTIISIPNLDSFAQAAPEIMKPYTFGAGDGSIVFSSAVLFNTPTPPCAGQNVACITWQYNEIGSDASQIGGPGGNATLPGGYNVISGQNVIIAEVYYNYQPLFNFGLTDYLTGNPLYGLTPQKLYKYAMYKPRQGTLTTLNAN